MQFCSLKHSIVDVSRHREFFGFRRRLSSSNRFEFCVTIDNLELAASALQLGACWRRNLVGRKMWDTGR